jgi:GxxExxY protein
LVADNTVIVELKATTGLSPEFERQVISYLAASGLPVALLINFGGVKLHYKRLFPPLSIQTHPAYQARRKYKD